jgi:hypothetical protein
MSMCRPRGGRSAPRYHHVKDAADERLWRLMHQKEKKSEVEEMTERLAISSLALDAMFAKVKESLRK